jgi:prophage regulatory protein
MGNDITTTQRRPGATRIRTTAIRHTSIKRDDGSGSAAAAPNERFIREGECRRITGLSRSTRWRLERGGKFPRRRQISSGCTGWLASEIAAWLAHRASL